MAPPHGSDRPNRSTRQSRFICRSRNLGCGAASRGNAHVENHRRDQQGQGRADLQSRGLWNRWRSLRNTSCVDGCRTRGSKGPLKIVPKNYQPSLPVDRFITREPLDAEAVPMDVVFVGGGPAGLAGAIELANLVKKYNESGGSLGEIQIANLQQPTALGEHCVSRPVV